MKMFDVQTNPIHQWFSTWG